MSSAIVEVHRQEAAELTTDPAAKHTPTTLILGENKQSTPTEQTGKQYPYERHTEDYWDIFAMCERVMYCCEWNHLQIWPEYGTLLGLLRHNGVIPWDYDADFGMWLEDRQKFKDAFQEFNKDGKMEIQEETYNDNGCLFICPKGRGDIVGLDIVFFYRDEKSGLIRSAQSDDTVKTYHCNRNYTHKPELLLPLKFGTFLGFQCWLPNKCEEIMTIDYGDWKQCPPDQVAKYAPHLLEKPILDMEETGGVHTLDALVKVIDGRKEPIIFRQTKILDISRERFKEILCSEPSVWGYDDKGAPETTGKALWEAYEQRCLKFNVVDSPVTDAELHTPHSELTKSRGITFLGNYDYSLTWIATNEPKRTYFHLDPPYGGGFMRLIEGEKIWWCVPSEHVTYLENRGHTEEEMSKMLLSQLMRLEDDYLVGKVFTGVIRGGDLLWFPPHTLHAVLTTADSVGLGGYL